MKVRRLFFAVLQMVIVVSCKTTELGLSTIKEGRSRAASSHAPGNSNYDCFNIKPGETATIFDVKGTGVINHIWLTFNEAQPNWISKDGSADPSELVIRMYWDNSAEPAVEAPVGDFFASGFGLRNEIKSLPVLVEGGDAYNCYWEMPFRKAAKITITNEGKKACRSFYYQIDYTEHTRLASDVAYFCAQYRQEFPETLGKDYLIADIAGKGHYVGTVMSVRSRSPYWFGEGDVKFYIDGEKEPSIWGTGTEDYFLSAWAFTKNLNPYSGCSYMNGGEEDLGTGYSIYRWHVQDPIRFNKSMRFEIEHTGWMSNDETETGKVDGHVQREDDIATVAFWYQQGQPKRFCTLPPAEERKLPNLDIITEGKDMIDSVCHSSGNVELQKGYNWTGDGQILFKPTTDNAWFEAAFTVEKEEYRGLILKMTNAPDYGMYRILLDGHPISRIPMTIDINFKNSDSDIEPRILDLYAKDLEIKSYYLGSATLKKGKHTIRFEQVGKNSLSTGNALGFDSFRLMQRWLKKRPSLR